MEKDEFNPLVRSVVKTLDQQIEDAFYKVQILTPKKLKIICTYDFHERYIEEIGRYCIIFDKDPIILKAEQKYKQINIVSQIRGMKVYINNLMNVDFVIMPEDEK